MKFSFLRNSATAIACEKIIKEKEKLSKKKERGEEVLWVEKKHEEHAKRILKECEEKGYTRDDVEILILALQGELEQYKKTQGKMQFKILPQKD